MEENKSFDFNNIIDELSTRFEDIIEEVLVDKIESAVTCTMQNFFPEVLCESFSNFEFVLTDGTIVRKKQHMKLLSPDKSKLVLCYGGLRVDGSTLIVQTRISCWESIAYYKTRE